MTEAEQDLAFEILKALHSGKRSRAELDEQFGTRSLYGRVLEAMTKKEGDDYASGIVVAEQRESGLCYDIIGTTNLMWRVATLKWLGENGYESPWT